MARCWPVVWVAHLEPHLGPRDPVGRHRPNRVAASQVEGQRVAADDGVKLDDPDRHAAREHRNRRGGLALAVGIYLCILRVLDSWLNYLTSKDAAATTPQSLHVQTITEAGGAASYTKKHVLLRNTYTRYIDVTFFDRLLCVPGMHMEQAVPDPTSPRVYQSPRGAGAHFSGLNKLFLGGTRF